MPDAQDFPSLFSETLARVRERMDADANGGLTANDPATIDTREGGFYWDATQGPAMECARLWDALTETIAAAFPSTAWGDYLDEHGATFGLLRNVAVAANGQLLFITADPTVIAANTQVSTAPSEPSGDTESFQTTTSATTVVPIVAPASVTVTPSSTGGTLTDATWIYHITAYNEFGETLGTDDATGVITGTTGQNSLTWTAVPDATGYNIYRTLTPGALGELIGTVISGLAFTDDGTVTPTLAEPAVNTTSGARMPAVAVVAGSAGNLGSNSVQFVDTPIAGLISVTNEDAMSGGADEENDEDFRARLLSQYRGSSGGGNVVDYQRWSTAQPGVERVSVFPVWQGPGTVLVVAMLADGSPVASTIVEALQAYLDPVSAQGLGQAPVGANVTVATSEIVEVNVTAAVTFLDGYSLDGVSGSSPTRSAILTALGDYLQSLGPGDRIMFQHVQALFFVPGVQSVAGLLVNSTTADIALSVAPPQVPILGVVTLG